MESLYKSLEDLGGNLVSVSEPNKNYVGAGRWITDNEKDLAVRVREDILIHERGSSSGFCWVRLQQVVLISCIFSPNRCDSEFENFLFDLSGEIQRQRTYKIVVAGDFNAHSETI
ncbi:hypothetical protein HHI36_017675 [Cryptolaemus montrouzieri]|uniref:Endonuclease/exonuclease/phosphatase domain-containing protein n=1 Tax=Cryptolaemus montrouzieri TaxID=559131 RepID=A0ABD2NPS2_9CUCU